MLNKEIMGITVIAILGLALHSIGSWVLNQNRFARAGESPMSVALPIPAQLFLASGDRYLAANINVFRAIMVDTNSTPDAETVETQAKLQTAASLLNPAHADNYYLAAATLSWQEQVPSAQYILQNAMNSRPQDLYAGFYLAFNKKHFENDILGAVKVLDQIAQRATGGNKQALTAMAARWSERASDSEEALNLVQIMIRQTRDSALKKYLKQRADRIEGLITLQKAAKRYTEQTGKQLEKLESLIQADILQSIPTDPTGFGYGIDPTGKPILLSRKKN